MRNDRPSEASREGDIEVSPNPTPWDFNEARAAARTASEAQREAENARRDAAETAARAELAYRKALAVKIVELHAEGVAWTVAQDVARGDEKVATLRYERDVAKGVLDAAEQRAWRHSADRKDTTEFIEWSRAVNAFGEQREPARRAA